jgi:hypothetical protein
MIMECREVRQLAESFVSEQLLVETTQVVVAHLGRCPACRTEVDGLRRLRAAIKAAFDASPELRPQTEFVSRVSTRLQSRAERRPRLAALRRWEALAAMLIVLAGAGAGLRAWSALGFAAVLHAAAGDHQFCALTYKLTERPIALGEAARRYDAVYGALETVEPSTGALSGGPVRVLERHSCIYDGRRFAHIVVRYKDRPVSILVAQKATLSGLVGPGPPSGAGPADMPETAGFRVAAFRVSQRMVFVVSALDQADVRDVAQAMAGPISKAVGGV